MAISLLSEWVSTPALLTSCTETYCLTTELFKHRTECKHRRQDQGCTIGV